MNLVPVKQKNTFSTTHKIRHIKVLQTYDIKVNTMTLHKYVNLRDKLPNFQLLRC